VDVELVGERCQLKQPRRLGTLLREAGGRADEIEIDVDLLLDPGAPNFDDDLAPVLSTPA
jgi:hypothetical protein